MTACLLCSESSDSVPPRIAPLVRFVESETGVRWQTLLAQRQPRHVNKLRNWMARQCWLHIPYVSFPELEHLFQRQAGWALRAVRNGGPSAQKDELLAKLTEKAKHQVRWT